MNIRIFGLQGFDCVCADCAVFEAVKVLNGFRVVSYQVYASLAQTLTPVKKPIAALTISFTTSTSSIDLGA
jgi:hypothetical protein